MTATCNPCTVEPGQTSNLTATGTDPDGDPLTYQWTAPQGTFNNPRRAEHDLDGAEPGRQRPGDRDRA